MSNFNDFKLQCSKLNTDTSIPKFLEYLSNADNLVKEDNIFIGSDTKMMFALINYCNENTLNMIEMYHSWFCSNFEVLPK
jgi:hypothetical protein